jgi:hypothetical protein
MITVMLSGAATRKELESAFDAYLLACKTKPMLILAHKDMAYEFPEQAAYATTRLHGVPILDLEEFVALHGEQLGFREEL